MTSTNEGCARGLFSRHRGETETLKPETEAETEALTIQAEARPRPRPSELETETRPRRTNSEARPSRGTTAPRDGLETEASRPRPHPGHQQNERKMAARRSSYSGLISLISKLKRSSTWVIRRSLTDFDQSHATDALISVKCNRATLR